MKNNHGAMLSRTSNIWITVITLSQLISTSSSFKLDKVLLEWTQFLWDYTKMSKWNIRREIVEQYHSMVRQSIHFTSFKTGAAVAEWLSSLLAEQEERGSIPGLAT